MKKIIASILIIFTLSMAFIVTTHSQEADLKKFIFESKILNSKLLSKKLVRFHVIANSDTDVDQNVKLQVKDAILQDMVPKLNVSKSKRETIEIINENAENIKNIAESTLKENNMTNEVTVALNTTFFPTKYYNDFSLPAGDYLALRVIIGSGEGKNWWCVLFPPLCLVDVKKEDPIEKDTISKEDKVSISLSEKLAPEELQTEKFQPKELQPKELKSKKMQPKKMQPKKMQPKKMQPKELQPKELQTEELSTEELSTEELSTEELSTEELSTEELVVEKKTNLDINLHIKEESRETNQNSRDEETPQIRWKALELLGFYKNSQNQ